MKILLANKFYYPRGGDCIYTINLEVLLKAQGHKVAVFAIQHSQNQSSAFQQYFPSEVSYASGNKKNLLKSALRPLGAREVKQKFTAILNDFRPDVVHLNNIHTHLSPVLAGLAHQKQIRVVWTLHDYKLVCPAYLCLRNGKTCTECFHNKSAVVKYSCLKNSKTASILAYLEALKWNREKLENYTDTFICPSEFMKSRMLAGGFSENKLKVIHNFTTIRENSSNDFHKENYYCYAGRLSEEKGIATLLRAARQLPYPLHVAGKGPLFDRLKTQYAGDQIRFLGHLAHDEVKNLIGKARFSVIPSEWYENNPLSVLESLCLGTPVLGANIGGIPELIEEGFNGFLSEPGNGEDLKNAIEKTYQTGFDYAGIRQQAQARYSPEKYYDQIMSVYDTFSSLS